MSELAPTRPGDVAVVTFERPVAVVGDIHGRSDLLDRLLARLPADMPIVSVGDVGDRGPDTAGVVDRLLARGAIGVRGNHEEWLIEWALGRGFDGYALSAAMGGAATLASYGVDPRRPAETLAGSTKVPAAHRGWFERLPLVLDLRVCGTRYWVVHAGIPSTVDLPGLRPDEVVPYLARTRPDTLLWAKNDPEEMLPVDRTVIMGHLRLPRPIDTGTTLAIDTGAGTLPDGALTAVLLPSRTFVGVR